MNTKIMQISPALAAKYLERNPAEKQRRLVPRRVTEYALAMKNGHWVLNHQGIAFDELDDLCDGQHRLKAIVESGCTIPMFVTRGLPVRQGELFTFDSIDVGMKRHVATNLQVRHGVENASNMAAAARVIAIICKRGGHVAMSVASTLAILDHFGTDARFVFHKMNIKRMKTGPLLGTLAFCRHAVGTSLDAFIEQVGDGAGLGKTDPAYHLRNYMLTHTVRGGCLADCEKAAALCAMNAMLGNKMKLIRSSWAGIDFFCDKQPRIVESIASMFRN